MSGIDLSVASGSGASPDNPGEVDPTKPSPNGRLMVYLAAQQDVPGTDKEIFGIGLHFPFPSSKGLMWFSFPVRRGDLLDETAEIKNDRGIGFCFDMRDKILQFLQEMGDEQEIRIISPSSLAAAIRAHIMHWNRIRRRTAGDWNRVIH